MARAERQSLIEGLGKARGGRLCVGYVTSTRLNFEMQIADDVLRLLYDHLEAQRDLAKVGVDLFLHSNGGSGTAPWRIVNLIREYTENFAVLVPHHAFSAATLIALGADQVVMHKMGCLGPIDPSVANIFNPPNPQNPGQLAPISVEDVSAYFKLVSEEVGIHHEDELIQALLALTEKIHPLALGNVQRSHHQSRMLARKLLRKHMTAEEEHSIDKIIDNLKSNLFYHGHPINRSEAEKDLDLKVVRPTPDIEELMWKLYLEYESALRLTEPYNPLHELDVNLPAAPPQPLTTQQIVQQMMQLAQNGISLQNVSERQLVGLAAAIVPLTTGGADPARKVRLSELPGAYVESVGKTNVFRTDLTIERTTINTPAGPQDGFKQEVLWQRWESEN